MTTAAIPDTAPPGEFPIVGIGASAGGLAAFTAFFSGMPAKGEPGMAFVLVQHLSPDHSSMLTELIQRTTRMQVVEVEDGMVVKNNCVYIIPPNQDLHVHGEDFRMAPISKPRGWPDVITVFLTSLSQFWKGKLVAIIVSGLDGDGAAAMCNIKAIGGTTIAQKPSTAIEPVMPESPMASGCIDLVLSPEDIAQEIIQITRAEQDADTTTSRGEPHDRIS